MWETLRLKSGPPPRHGHSCAVYGDKIFVYGGAPATGQRAGPAAHSDLWAFDASAKTWENVSVATAACDGGRLACGPLRSAGHTATVVTNSVNKKADRMVVVFGHSPELGYLNTVQEYYFGTREWHVVDTKGYPVKGEGVIFS